MAMVFDDIISNDWFIFFSLHSILFTNRKFEEARIKGTLPFCIGCALERCLMTKFAVARDCLITKWTRKSKKIQISVSYGNDVFTKLTCDLIYHTQSKLCYIYICIFFSFKNYIICHFCFLKLFYQFGIQYIVIYCTFYTLHYYINYRSHFFIFIQSSDNIGVIIILELE